jgi:hypothetical protein
VRTILAVVLLSAMCAQVAGAWENIRQYLYIENMNAPDEIEHYDSVKHITGKRQRHFKTALEFKYNEDMYVGQCVNALKDQAILVGAHYVLNMSWKLERKYSENWFTVICQGLATWKY